MTAVESTTARSLTYVEAIKEAITQSMREDPSIFLAGEDVALYGGVFGTSRGLLAEFGPERVVDTPISESGLVGMGVGAAATGLRPIIEIMFMDFIGVCMDEIVNQAAKMKYMFGGSARLPLTIRTMAGGGMNMAAQHSQSLEAWLCHVPGLKVVMPSGAYEAKGLLVAAIRDDNPVIVIEQKLMLGRPAEVPEELYEIELGKAHVVKPGSNFTIVALGRMVSESLKAAEVLSADGLDVEVIDPRTLQPLDTATIVDSLKKTHRAVVVHEAVRFGGLGAEIAAQMQEEGFDYLDAPVGRVGAPFAPVPFSPALEREYIPNADKIVAEVRRILGKQV
ncbi:MAG: alpha-ketoacid dehydrogenase subunit beta [Dehalococcoidia bacterium]|nr:alpha-ketoacid dehydrogenase subunit beta [Dehalococcoidia bacterium]